MAKHERPGKSDEWYTPPYVFKALGAQFDLDVASPGAHIATHVPAADHISRDSLNLEWWGFVWMNPPFGGRNGLTPWLDKFLKHGNGVALVPDRTSAPWWTYYAPKMDALLFVAPKIKFIPGRGAKASSPAQGTTLMALGPHGYTALRNAACAGLGALFYPAILP